MGSRSKIEWAQLFKGQEFSKKKLKRNCSTITMLSQAYQRGFNGSTWKGDTISEAMSLPDLSDVIRGIDGSLAWHSDILRFLKSLCEHFDHLVLGLLHAGVHRAVQDMLTSTPHMNYLVREDAAFLLYEIGERWGLGPRQNSTLCISPRSHVPFESLAAPSCFQHADPAPRLWLEYSA